MKARTLIALILMPFVSGALAYGAKVCVDAYECTLARDNYFAIGFRAAITREPALIDMLAVAHDDMQEKCDE